LDIITFGLPLAASVTELAAIYNGGSGLSRPLSYSVFGRIYSHDSVFKAT
jgi:hypothetical protein